MFQVPLDKSQYLVPEQSEWRVSRDGDMLEKRAHPDRDSVGDMRVRYYSLGNATKRLMVSMIGMQKDLTIIPPEESGEEENQQGIFRLALGEDKSLKDMIKDA